MADVRQSIETFPASDGYALHYRSYQPVEGKEKGYIVCLHGIQSHGGWYIESCRRLAAAGYRVSYFDRRGSGLNWRQRGDTSNFHRLLDDIREFITQTTPPGLPAVLLAKSWGGKLGVLLAAEPQPVFEKLILLCPGLFPQVRPPLSVRLGIARARLLRPGRMFPIPLSDPRLFTSSPSHQAFLASDPLSIHYATARLLVESVRIDRRVRALSSLSSMPILLLLAEHDAIIRNDRTKEWLHRVAPRVQVIQYRHAHHTLEFEPHQPFVADLLRWLEK